VNNSNIPSWLQDKKKVLILGIVLLALILSAFNTARIATRVYTKIADDLSITTPKVGDIFKGIGGNKLDGTYQNIYAEESMTFDKDGTVIYTYGESIAFGDYEIDTDNYLLMNLNGNAYSFHIVTNDGKTLVINDGYYDYTYEKQ